jgi:hypothetical protein
MSAIQRSLSRGRNPDMHLTGRGGAGNYRSPSRGHVVGERGPEDYSDTRGRDPIPSRDPNEVTSTGRGGAGNIRSPSRGRDDASPDTSPLRSEHRGRGYDRETISMIDEAQDGVRSFGRGGAGNMSPARPISQSRSRSREPVHASGRGGAGNIHVGGPTEMVIEEMDESERAAHHLAPGVHTSGRGGIANLSSGKLPHVEGGNPHGANHPHSSHVHDTESHGRGGRGNISRDHSREPGLRNTHNAPSGLSVSS